MGIQEWSEDIILVDLPAEPDMGEELKTVTTLVRDRGDCDVVIDFSNVDIVTSSSLSKLLKLRKLLSDCGHRLVFCSVAPATKGIFTVTGLEGIFELADDKFPAGCKLELFALWSRLRRSPPKGDIRNLLAGRSIVKATRMDDKTLQKADCRKPSR